MSAWAEIERLEDRTLLSTITLAVQQIADIQPGPSSSFPESLTPFDGKLYFGGGGPNGDELHAFNPATGSVTEVIDLHAGVASSFPEELTPLDGKLYFRAQIGSGSEFFVFDPATATASPIGSLSFPGSFTALGGRLYFRATGANGQELYSYDPVGGTLTEFDIRPGSSSSAPAQLAVFKDKLFFAATGPNGRELYSFDPAIALLEEVVGPNAGNSNPAGLTVFDGRLFFRATGINGQELFAYDPATGIVDEFNINPGFDSSSPAFLTPFDGKLFFQATVAAGAELYVFNPAGDSVTLAADLEPGTGSSEPEEFAVFGGKLYFSASVGGDRELYAFDPATGSAALVENINTSASSNPEDLTPFAGLLIFRGNSGAGDEVHAFDPADGSVAQLADIDPGTSGSFPVEFTEFDGKLFFSTLDALGAPGGSELYAVVPVGTLTGTKFEDLDGDGVRDPGEAGLAGITVYLDLNDNGQLERGSGVEPDDYSDQQHLTNPLPGLTLSVLDGNSQVMTTPVMAALVDSDLRFGHDSNFGPEDVLWGETFRSLRIDFASPADSVSIDFISQGGGAGWLRAFDAQGNMIGQDFTQLTTMTVAANGIAFAIATITGGNGYLDSLKFSPLLSEPVSFTDANGDYAFTDLAAGDYVVREVVSSGFRQTTPGGAPRLFAIDDLANGPSQLVEINPLTGAELNRFMAPGNSTGNTAGLAFDGRTLFFVDAVDDTLYELDPDSGAVRDSMNLVTLTGVNDRWDGLAAIGGHVYVNAPTSPRQVFVIDPASNTLARTITFPQGSNHVPAGGLGEVELASGTALVGTIGLSTGVAILDAQDGSVIDTFSHQSVLDGDHLGAAGLGDGIYIGFNNPAGSVHVFDNEGTFLRSFGVGFPMVGLAGGGDGAHRVSLGPGQTLAELDFGNEPITGELHGVKFIDENGDGLRDPLEDPQPGVTIYLDANNNGRRDAGERSTITDANGEYVFRGLVAAEYIVREVTPARYRQTSPDFTHSYYAYTYVPGTSQMQPALIDPETGEVRRVGTPRNEPEERMHGLVRTNSGQFFGIDGTDPSDDFFFALDLATNQVTRIGQVTVGGVPTDVAFGLAYNPETDTIHGLVRDPSDNLLKLATYDRTTGAATLVGPGTQSLTGTSGMAFDTDRDVLVAYDFADDQFWQFDLAGNPTLLWDTDGFQGRGFAWNGTEFVLHAQFIDDGDPNLSQRLMWRIDPYQQTVDSTFFVASEPIFMESLDYFRVDGGHLVFVGDQEVVTGLDFGNQFVNAAPVAVDDAYVVPFNGTLEAGRRPGADALVRYGFDESSTGDQPALDTGAAPAADGTFNGASRTGDTPAAASLGALDLTGAGTRYVTAGDLDEIDGLTELTVTLWLNLQAAPTAGDTLVSDLPDFMSGSKGWELSIGSNFNGEPVSADNFTVSFTAYDGLGGGGASGQGLSANGRWAFVAATFFLQDVGGETFGFSQLWGGDEESAVGSMGDPSAGNTLLGGPNNQDLRIGAVDQPVGERTPPTWIDDVRIYGRPLSQAELEAVRREGIQPPPPSVVGNDTDADGDPLVAALVSGPTHGALALNPDGSFTYTPHAGFAGSDSFTYQANDGTADSNLATVTLIVQPGFLISETGGATVVSENSSPDLPQPETDTFTVVLTSPPAADTVVVLDITSSDSGEAAVSPAQLTFNSTNWDQPQTITVQGINDNLADGNQAVTITVSVDDGQTTDDSFDPLADQTLSVTVLDVPVTPTMLGPLTGQENVPSQTTFTWNDVAGATSYNIWLIDRADGTLEFSKFDIPVGDSFQLPTDDALAEGDYRYWFSANNANGFSNWSGPHDFSAGSASSVPAVPAGFNTSAGGDPQQPTITWNPVAGATSYRIWMVNLQTGGLVASDTNLPSASFTPAAPLAQAKHRLYVQASNAAGTSAWSTPFDFDVGDPLTVPVPPATFSTDATVPRRPVVEWNAVSGAAFYNIWLVNLETGGLVASDRGLTGNSFTPSGDLAETRHRIYVQAGNLAGTSGWSAPFDFDVGGALAVPAAPTGLGATNTDTGRPTIHWNVSPGAAHYAIWFINLDTSALVSGALNLTAPSFAPQSDVPDGDYRFYVRAVNAAGSSGWAGPFDFSVEVPGSAPLMAASSGGGTDDSSAQSSSSESLAQSSTAGVEVVLVERRARHAALTAGTPREDRRDQQLALAAASSGSSRAARSLSIERALSEPGSNSPAELPALLPDFDAELEATLVDAVFAAASWLDSLASL